ncbi:hypothetical protein FRC19_001349 [Serendipita sp. 401]|nr:hypothetical protein FRC19_001349 [Serendipita sp. 401]
MTPVTDASFWIMLGEITDGGALLVGPVLDQNTLETQIVMSGGGPFVRGISNATVDLVLGYLGITAEGYKILRESEDETKDEQVQWFRYEDDIKPYLRPKGGNEPPPHTNTGADAGAEPADEKEVEDVQLYIDDEDAGSRGFLPQPWHGPRFSDGSINATKYKVMKGDSSWRALLRNCSLVSPDAASTLLDSITGNTAEDKRDYTINLLKTIIEVDIEALLRVDWFSRIGKSVITKCTTNSQESFLALLMAHIDRHFDTNVQRMLRDWIEVVDPDTPSDIHRLMDTDPDASAETASVLILDADAPKLCGLVEADLLTVAGSYQKPTFEKIGNLLRYTRVLSRSAVTDDTRSIILTKEPLTTFRAIPHLAFQELVYAPRTAAILAMIAVTAHIPHLIRPAQAFLETTQGTWLNLRIPENFSTPFVTFLLAAPCSSSVLNAQEKETFTNMARYAHLEEQIDTKIQAKTPWTPMKTRGVGDRKRECAGCGIRRSETMMHQVGSYEYTRPDKLENGTGMRCGMCVDSDTKKPEDWKDKGEIASCWVECSERWCRAQYVIEDEEGLRIPPRCYYCRKRKPCPWIECTLCANRIILPKSYRNLPGDSLSSFTCPPCLNQKHTGHKSVVHKLTTLRSILFANDYEVGWLGIKPFREVFRGRTTFMLFELYGFDIFTPAPPAGQSPPPSPASDRGKTKRLLLQGKKLLNPAELKEEVNGIIGRTMGRGRIICPITFNFVNEQDLLRACANTGCSFRASKEGLKRWFTGSSSDPRRAQCPACRDPQVIYS